VQQFGWSSDHQFLDAVAVAMITPGPVVITVVFIAFLVAGILGAMAAAIGIFVPVYIFTVVPAPWFSRNRDNVQLKAFVQGATAAATGALSGAVVVLAARAIYDIPTAVIALVTFAVLWRFKIPEPIVVLVAVAVGLGVWLLARGA
jgi:chromate transporter